jgi:eukaryotic-like serine/threonine-protein kinase
MTVAAGTRLGPYQVTAKLGAGGMGEVWRATDSRLDREVAIKVLPAAFTEDRDRLARFEREAKLLAQLHHTNIASIFGLEEYDGVRALVMGLVEGPTLAERLGAGPISLEESLSIARQIAEALEEAHAKGIVHRDLKPQNVKAPVGGTVKVLDFGLAKAMAPSGEMSAADIGLSPAIMNSPTMTVMPGTQLGVILGTAAYMSPEQACGGMVDKRSDVWALGVVLFEMLSGRSLFAADTVSETLAAVLKTDIDFSALPASTPPALRQLLRRCLERNPKNRLHDVADARIVIDDLIAGRALEEEAPSGRERWSRPAAAAWAAALVVAGATAAMGVVYATRPVTKPSEPLRLSIALAPGQEIVNGANANLTFSPDGSTLVFAGRINGRQHLFRRALDGREAVPIAGTDDGDAAFFSPDGRWIGFVSGGQIMKVASEGGRPFRVADQKGVGACAWLRDGTIVFVPIYSDGLFRVSVDGGTPQRLTTPDRASGELGHWWPEALPGDRYVVFTAFRTPVDKSRLGVLDLSTGEVRWVVDGGFFGRYVSTGHLVYARGQRLYAVPFDLATATVKGAAVAVLDDVLASQTSGYATFGVSSRGMLAYVTESLGNPLRELVWLDRAGRPTPAAGERRRFQSVSLSPDDRQAALTIHGDSRDIWITSLERHTFSRLTTGEGTEFDPVWSHSEKELFYVVDRPPFQLHRIGVGDPDTGRPIWSEVPTIDSMSMSVSPDGRTIAYEVDAPETGRDLYARPLDGGTPARPIRVTRSEDRNVSFSPDGSWVVYQSNESGRSEIYAQPFPGPGDRIQLSSDGGTDPVWARNGEIFYLHENQLRVIAARAKGRVEFDAPRTLFTYPIIPATIHDTQTFDVTRDGARVIAVTVPEGSEPRQLEVVTDWARELERLVPRSGG